MASPTQSPWHTPGTTDQDREEIIRHLVEKVVVHVKNNNSYVDLSMHWQGGFVSQYEVVRPVACYEQLRDLDKLMERITVLRHEALTSAAARGVSEFRGIQPSEAVRSILPDARPPTAEAP
ncbi:MAG: hypothetical protein AB7I30_22470 [Isosphaeraceae bacterium]